MVGLEADVKSCLGAAFACYIVYGALYLLDTLKFNPNKFLIGSKSSNNQGNKQEINSNLQRQQSIVKTIQEPQGSVMIILVIEEYSNVIYSNQSFILGGVPDSQGVVMMDNQPYVVERPPGSQEIVMVGERPYTYARILTQQELSKIRSQTNTKIGRTNTQRTSADKNPAKVKQSEKIIDHSASNEEMKIEDLEYDDHEELKQNNDQAPNVVRPQNVSIVEGHIANPNTNNIGQYENDKDPFFTQVVHRFPKAIIWYFMVLTFTATRASTEFGIVMCYLSLVGRAVQVVGIVIKKPIISGIGYGLSLIILCMLFGNAMFYEAD